MYEEWNEFSLVKSFIGYNPIIYPFPHFTIVCYSISSRWSRGRLERMSIKGTQNI
jgi:hypothetical protein